MYVNFDLRLSVYTDTEVMMNKFGLSKLDVMSKFEKSNVNEICVNAKDVSDEFYVASLIGLQYSEDENTIEWKKEEFEHSSDLQKPTIFQELQRGNEFWRYVFIALRTSSREYQQRNIDCHW